MHDLEKFEIEAGSELKIVEDAGLSYIGGNTELFSSNRTGTLVLPSTLSSVYLNGIYHCNLFHTVIYCGPHYLSNSSTLETVSPATVVKVTS